MYELTHSECQSVGGGNGNGASAGSPSQGASQVCSSISGNGTQCTSNNGRSMVITTYDSKGGIVSITTCNENRDVSIKGKVTPQVSGEARGGGGTSCTQRVPVSSSQGPDASGQLLVQSPFFYGAP